MEIASKIFKYGFHDTYIDSINVLDSYIDLYFKNGLFELDKNGTETVSTLPVKMRIFVDNKYFTSEDVFMIEKIYPSYKNIEINDFLKLISNKSIDVDNIFYSRFNQTILIKCGYKNEIYLLGIENVVDVDYTEEMCR